MTDRRTEMASGTGKQKKYNKDKHKNKKLK